jgi:hypothetical protein
MFNEDDNFAVNFERNIIEEIHIQHVLECVNGNRSVMRESDSPKSAIKFPKQIGVAEQFSKDTVLVVSVCFHAYIWVESFVLHD